MSDKPKCPRCGNEIDPEVCWCGDYVKNHNREHNPVPMGCVCGYEKEEEPATHFDFPAAPTPNPS